MAGFEVTTYGRFWGDRRGDRFGEVGPSFLDRRALRIRARQFLDKSYVAFRNLLKYGG